MRALGTSTGFEAARDPGDNLAVNLLAYAQYLVGSYGYYRVTYRPVTILAPVNQLSAGGLPLLGERRVMMTRKGPDSVDRIVGRNIRIYRLQKGLTQTELADQLELTFQQVQKYEKGTNRVGSGRLLKIAIFLGVPVTALFRGSDEMADTDKQSIFDQLAKPHANRLLQAFARIDDDALRRSVVQLVEEIAKNH
jgi:transcriptional regulator with XRE-family HTH domain